MSHVALDEKRPWLGGNTKGGHPGSYKPLIWDWFIERYNPKSIIDIGCGEGHLMDYFYGKGIKVNGIEGLQENKDNAPERIRDYIYIHDYTNGCPDIIKPDMVIACEFVEHVEEKYIKNFLPQFVSCDYLIFTHARPNQCGYHHVNCQKSEYWIDLITQYNFEFLEEDSNYARFSICNPGFWETLLIFKNKENG